MRKKLLLFLLGTQLLCMAQTPLDDLNCEKVFEDNFSTYPLNPDVWEIFNYKDSWGQPQVYTDRRDEIIINYSEKGKIILNVDKKGNLSQYEYNVIKNVGKFENEEIDFYISWGGLGGGGSIEISGIKN